MKKVNSSKVCLVCGSGPTNNNYGAFTCSPCKVFFHRNVHMDLNINQCQIHGQCQINVNNRIICRVCRLKKCFNIGMSEDLFRSPNGRIPINKNKIIKKENVKLIINQYEKKYFQLRFDEQILLLNIIDSYDICSPISNINQIIQISSNNPSKMRVKIEKNNLKIIQTYFYSSIISFIKINQKFSSLSKNDRLQLIQRNIHNLSGLNQLFIYDQIHFFNDQIEQSLILDQYGPLYLDYLLKSIEKMPSDRRIIKLFLIILTFSTCSDIVYFHSNQFSGKCNQFPSTLNLFNIQNIYVEILFKYLINIFGYDEASKQFQNLIQIILTQNQFLQIGLTDQQHHQIVQTILNQIEQDYQMDYQEIMDLSH